MTFGSLQMNIDAAKQSLLTEISRSRKLNTYDSTKAHRAYLDVERKGKRITGQGQSIDGTWNLIYLHE